MTRDTRDTTSSDGLILGMTQQGCRDGTISSTNHYGVLPGIRGKANDLGAPTAPCAAERLDALAACLEALDIAHGATIGDQATRDAILIERAGHAVAMLQGILGGDAWDRPAAPERT